MQPIRHHLLVPVISLSHISFLVKKNLLPSADTFLFFLPFSHWDSFFFFQDGRSRTFVAQPLGTSDRQPRPARCNLHWNASLPWLLSLTAPCRCSSDVHQLSGMSGSRQRLLRVGPWGLIVSSLFHLLSAHKVTVSAEEHDLTSTAALTLLVSQRLHHLIWKVGSYKKHILAYCMQLDFSGVRTLLEYFFIWRLACTHCICIKHLYFLR